MVSFSQFKDSYDKLWGTLDIRSDRVAAAQQQADRILAGKPRYQDVESRTGVPWWFVGLCHYREANLNFDCYLGNGQPLGQRTTIVPKGRGPFAGPTAFLDGAIDALTLEGFLGAKDWSIARVLYRLEGFNGYGYHFKGVNSPYLWGGSTAYGPPAPGGKYVRDHDFDPTVVDTQLGTAVILKVLTEKDGSIGFGPGAAPAGLASSEPDDDLAATTLWVQQSLNRLGAVPPLVEDGKSGRYTRAAVALFQVRHGLDDSGLADARTITAIRDALRPAAVPDVDALQKRIEDLERQLAAARIAPQLVLAPAAAVPPAPVAAPASPDILALIGKLDAFLRTLPAGPPSGPGRDAPGAPPLGKVNGALGQTIGTLLDGKKSAIGIIGAVVTQILSQVPAGTGLGQVLAQLTPAAGLSPYALPIFLGLTAWGALGKFEKWNQASPLPAK